MCVVLVASLAEEMTAQSFALPRSWNHMNSHTFIITYLHALQINSDKSETFGEQQDS